MIRPVQKDLYAVIGNPVEHSLSPVMMNAVFAKLKIPAVYLALQVDNLAEDLVTLSRMGIRGLSVTIPHKESACDLAAAADEPSRVMGAVNTLRRDGSQWEGRNTDWVGAVTALRQQTDHFAPPSGAGISPAGHEDSPRKIDTTTLHPSLFTLHSFAGKRALIVGAGGVARAVVYGLRHEGAAITISNRGIARGEALAKAFDGDFIPLSELSQATNETAFDIIVQCTPVGLMNNQDHALKPDSLRIKNQERRAKSQEPGGDFALIPDSLFRPGAVVMDTVYRPLWTPFLRKARAGGCITIAGVEMLLHQGVAQLEWWLGEMIQPEEVLPIMRKALMGILGDE
jgi:shikimate dehydrogenase